MGGDRSRAQHPGGGIALREDGTADSGHGASVHTRDVVLPLAVRQRLWDQLWQRLLAPVPAMDQPDADGEGR